MRVEMELCNLPRERVISYLVEIGGKISDPCAVIGPDWSAKLIKMEPAQVGVIRVPRDLLVIEGDPHIVEPIHAFMRRRTMRGGG